MGSESWENFRIVRDMNKKSAKLSPSESSVLWSIAAHGNDYGTSFPSQELIAAETGMSVRSVVRAVSTLVELGYITVTVGKRGNNFYRMELDVMANLPTCEKPDGTDVVPPSHLAKCQDGVSVVPGWPSKIQEDKYKTQLIASLRECDIAHIISHKHFWVGVLSLSLTDEANGLTLS